jgi:hypothetical protein
MELFMIKTGFYEKYGTLQLFGLVRDLNDTVVKYSHSLNVCMSPLVTVTVA